LAGTNIQQSKPTRFLNKVGTFVAQDPVTQLVMFTGIFNATTNVSVTMTPVDTRGGVGNALLMRTYSDRTVEVTLTTRDWNLEYVAASVGGLINPGLSELYDIEVPVQLNNLGVGALPRSGIGMVHVKLPNGTKFDVPIAADNTIDLSEFGVADLCVKCTYRFATHTDTVTINTSASPYIIHLFLQSGISDTMKGLMGQVLVEIPSFALDGNFTIETNADGTAAEITLVGVALAVDGTECKEGMVYGYVREAIEDYKAPQVIEIVASPSPMMLSLLPAPESQTISVVGNRGIMVSTVGIAPAELTYVSDTPTVATVDAMGVVTAVTAGEAVITVAYSQPTGDLTDTIDVIVA